MSAGAPPQTPLGELTALPRPPSWLQGALLIGSGPTSKGRGGKGRGGEGRERKGKKGLRGEGRGEEKGRGGEERERGEGGEDSPPERYFWLRPW